MPPDQPTSYLTISMALFTIDAVDVLVLGRRASKD